MELRDILARLKTENGLTTDMLSVRSGVPKGTLNKLLNGETRNPTGGTLKKIADALNCPVQALVDGEGSRLLREEETACAYTVNITNATDILPVKRHSVPMLGVIAAGTPIYADQAADVVACSDGIHCDFALRVRGDSMVGARIMDGDIVFIRAQDDVDDGDIAAIVVDDEATLKRVYHIRNGVQLLSENPKYPPMLFTLDDCDSIHILGKAVGFQSSF